MFQSRDWQWLALAVVLLIGSLSCGGGGGGTTPPDPKPDPEVAVELSLTGPTATLYDRFASLTYLATPQPSAEFTDSSVQVIFTVQFSTDTGKHWTNATELRATGTGKQRGIPQELPLGRSTTITFLWDAEPDLKAAGSESTPLETDLRVIAEQATGPGEGTSNLAHAMIDWAGTTGCVVVAPSIQTGKELILTADSPVNRQLLSAGGDLPLTWVVDGGLPGTLKVDSSGAMTGTPTVVDTTLILTLTDSCAVHPRRDRQFLRLKVLPPDCPALRFLPAPSIPEAQVGKLYNVDIRAQLDSDGKGNLAWKLAPGTHLPAGITFTPTGLLQGTPADGSAGFYPLSITVSDVCSPPQSETEQFLLAVSN